MYTGQKGLGPDNLNLRKVTTFSRNVDVCTHLAFFFFCYQDSEVLTTVVYM